MLIYTMEVCAMRNKISILSQYAFSGIENYPVPNMPAFAGIAVTLTIIFEIRKITRFFLRNRKLTHDTDAIIFQKTFCN